MMATTSNFNEHKHVTNIDTDVSLISPRTYCADCTYSDDDLIDVNRRLVKRHRFVKYKHYVRLLAIGERMKEQLNKEGMPISFKSLAQKYGCDVSLVSKVANGVPNVQMAYLIGILDAVDLDLYISIESGVECEERVGNPTTLCLSQINLQNKLERIGSVIKRERSRRNISLLAFAEILNMSRPTLMRLERGYPTAFLYHYLLAADYLGLTIKLAISERNPTN